ncbi:cytidine/deoxycytidylate deaminase family protein [Fodinicola feengrottensis]|uniref:dCMP deaminase n=1 Tax=Fodinicola feengrottensis TaxID=435914 RepID=UPI002442BEBA|nr:dCMP deaminase [Fodinicola feengrottensis]
MTVDGDRDHRWLAAAIELSESCPPSRTAFSVGAYVVDADDTVLATGYSREGDPVVHAEEVALLKLPGVDLAGATVYSSLEPCSQRASRPVSCARLILRAGVGRVVFGWREPAIFTDCDGAEILRTGGVDVMEIPELAAAVRLINAHLMPS